MLVMLFVCCTSQKEYMLILLVMLSSLNWIVTSPMKNVDRKILSLKFHSQQIPIQRHTKPPFPILITKKQTLYGNYGHGKLPQQLIDIVVGSRSFVIYRILIVKLFFFFFFLSVLQITMNRASKFQIIHKLMRNILTNPIATLRERATLPK